MVSSKFNLVRVECFKKLTLQWTDLFDNYILSSFPLLHFRERNLDSSFSSYVIWVDVFQLILNNLSLLNNEKSKIFLSFIIL